MALSKENFAPSRNNGGDVKIQLQQSYKEKPKVTTKNLANNNSNNNGSNVSGSGSNNNDDDKQQTVTPSDCVLGGYHYDCDTVINLTQLIGNNLKSKPELLSRNKIFERVRKTYFHMKMKQTDTELDMCVAVQRLLAACVNSNWFTERQEGQFNQWRHEQGWL